MCRRFNPGPHHKQKELNPCKSIYDKGFSFVKIRCTPNLGCLKTIIAPAIKLKVIKLNPFDDFVLNRKTVERYFLEMEEIKLIHELKCKTKEIEFKRDLFVFACFTGLAYADLKAFAKKDIVKDNDGSFLIRHPRAKTGVFI